MAPLLRYDISHVGAQSLVLPSSEPPPPLIYHIGVEEFPSAVQRYGREPDCAFMRREPGPETKAGARLASNGYFIHLIHIPARLWLTELCAGATALCVSTGRQAGGRAGGREGRREGGRERSEVGQV